MESVEENEKKKGTKCGRDPYGSMNKWRKDGEKGSDGDNKSSVENE